MGIETDTKAKVVDVDDIHQARIESLSGSQSWQQIITNYLKMLKNDKIEKIILSTKGSNTEKDDPANKKTAQWLEEQAENKRPGGLKIFIE